MVGHYAQQILYTYTVIESKHTVARGIVIYIYQGLAWDTVCWLIETVCWLIETDLPYTIYIGPDKLDFPCFP